MYALQADTVPVCVGPGGVTVVADFEVESTGDEVEVVVGGCVDDAEVVMNVVELTETLFPSTQ